MGDGPRKMALGVTFLNRAYQDDIPVRGLEGLTKYLEVFAKLGERVMDHPDFLKRLKKFEQDTTKDHQTDAFIVQTKVLWDKGWGIHLGFKTIEEYRHNVWEFLGNTPNRPVVDFLNKLILVDRRVQLVDGCWMAGLKFNGSNETFIPYDPKTAKKHGDVYWMWCQDGRRNRNKIPHDCRERFFKIGGLYREVGLDAFEFVALYAQDPTVIGTKEDPHSIDLPGSRLAEGSAQIACGGGWVGQPELFWEFRHIAFPNIGSASRLESGTQSPS